MCECDDGYTGILRDKCRLGDGTHWKYLEFLCCFFWLVEAIPCTLTDGSMVDDGTRFESGEPCMQDW